MLRGTVTYGIIVSNNFSKSICTNFAFAIALPTFQFEKKIISILCLNKFFL